MRTILIIILLCVFSACESIIEVETPSDMNKIVTHSFFTPDSLWTVNVGISFHTSKPLFTGLLVDRDKYIVIVKGDEGVVDTLREVGGSFGTNYRSAHDRRPHPGATYELRVEIPGYTYAEASSRLPEIVPMRNIVYSDDSGASSLRFTIEDPLGANYYRLELFQLVPDDGITPFYKRAADSLEYRRIFFRSTDPAFRHRYGDVDDFQRLDDVDLEFSGQSIFSDVLFENASRDIEITFQPYSFEDVEPRFLVILSTLSSDFFMYQYTLDRHRKDNAEGDEGLFETFPVPVYTNIKNGYGVFAGYVSDTYRFDLDGNEWQEQ